MHPKERPDIEAKFDLLKQRFREKAENDLAWLQALVASGDSGGLTGEQVRECYKLLHRLAGSAGTFGWFAVGNLARRLERRLKPLVEEMDNTGWVPDQEFLGRVRVLRGALAQSASSLPTREADSAVISESDSPQEPDQITVLAALGGNTPLSGEITAELSHYGFCIEELGSRAELWKIDPYVASEANLLILVDDSRLADAMAFARGLGVARLQGNVPVICISGDASFVNRYRTADMGASALFSHPVEIPLLADRIERLIREQNETIAGRVLIVDDDLELASHYRLALESAGMVARYVSDPDKLLDELSEFQPDIVLMDLQIGGHSGVTLSRLIRFEPEWLGLPIIYLSSEEDRDQQLDALSNGADEFLLKPIDDDYLIRSARIRCYRARQISDLLNRDSLTGLLKHSLIKQELEKEVARVRRSGHCSCVVMLDIDHFKSVNDSFGHRIGDVVIKSLSNLLRNRLRQTDLIGRYGGEEFVLVLPDSSESTTRAIVEDIGRHFAEIAFSDGVRQFHVTLSAGVAELTDYETGEAALGAADQALYWRKRHGRAGVTAVSDLEKIRG